MSLGRLKVGTSIFGHIRLRDRDAIITPEGLIFRVLGYTHPPDGYICDIEYAPSEIYQSSNTKAYRSDGKRVFYKFYGDEGWKFLLEKYPKYMLDQRFLGRKVIGVKHEDIKEIRRPEDKLRQLIGSSLTDELIRALQSLLIIFEDQGLPLENFGIFGSLLHGFHNPKFSDLDIIIYGRKHLEEIRDVLNELYNQGRYPLKNEFADDSPISGKVWHFRNINPMEFLLHQRRKLIYAVFHDKSSGWRIKAEFEPVKAWQEISNEYQEIISTSRVGWIKAILKVINDEDGPFMPSIYYVEPVEILEGPRCDDILKVISYVEEFRMQCFRDEIVYAEGNLERVNTKKGKFHQITLTYGPRYYEQTLKVIASI
ncbi:MAG: nucleotidyltransferase domain-containing protein [Candidatus Bathyarchaeia archaeon]